ncbi:MAG: MFS transporter [Elusimicrobiales bacterium]|nr:MFS transporter [Elusimicrobiales bacterium]
MGFFKDMRAGLSRNVTFLGVVSGLTDISSEMLYPIVPVFLTSVLGAPMQVVGLIEGLAEATASFVKILGGRLSDRVGRRKPFVVAGYSLSAVSKPLLALAASWQFVLFSRFVDRVGKGLRTSARDALIAGSVDKAHWGKAFGFHRAMDTLGAALGPLTALALIHFMGAEKPDYRFIFLAAFLPALLGVGVLVWFVKEAAQPRPAGSAAPAPMSADFKVFVALYAVFALGNSSDVFLIMKARTLGFTLTQVILAYTAYNLVYALLASPAGWLADRLGKVRTMRFGFLVFALVYAGFALADRPWMLWALFALYGFYGAFSEGIAKAVIAHLSTAENRGAAMGYFQGTLGFLTFAASALAGLLWDGVSPAAPFIAGAACALLAGAALTFWTARKQLQF